MNTASAPPIASRGGVHTTADVQEMSPHGRRRNRSQPEDSEPLVAVHGLEGYMSTKSVLTASRWRRAAAASLGAAAAGIELQILGGAEYPTIPPGVLILLGSAAMAIFVKSRWGLLLASTATLFISIGGLVTPNLREQLRDQDAALVFAGSALQVVALVGALVFCAFGLRESFGQRRQASQVLGQ